MENNQRNRLNRDWTVYREHEEEKGVLLLKGREVSDTGPRKV